jgi:hypothetical protein
LNAHQNTKEEEEEEEEGKGTDEQFLEQPKI